MSFPARESYRGPSRGGGPGHAHRHSRSNSAISEMLGQAGQALGAIAAPQASTSTAAQPGPAHARAPARPDLDAQHHMRPQLRSTVSSPTSPSFGFGSSSSGGGSGSTGAIGHYPQQLPTRTHPALHSQPQPPLPTTDASLHLPPPSQSFAAGVPGTGIGTGTGIGFGSKQRAVSAAASASTSSHPPPAAAHHRPLHSAGPAASFPSNAPPAESPYPPASYARLGQHLPTRKPLPQLSRAWAPADALDPALSPPPVSTSGSGSRPSPTHRSMFGLPSIPTSNDDFASSIPHLNPTPDSTSAPASTTPASAPASTSKATMSQQPQQQQQYAAPNRRTGGYEEQHHISGPGPSQYQHGQLSPREYSTPSAGPQIKLDQTPSNPPSYQGTPAVPSVLQPGGPIGLHASTTVAAASAARLSDPFQAFFEPLSQLLAIKPCYRRLRRNPNYSPYTPTTPGGSVATSSQFMSPTDRGYNAPGSQRNMSHTPLGLADIRPRADSTLSDGLPSGVDFSMQNTPPGTSNYMAPWATYAFDWCKWAPQGNGAGKVAIGSYLEDGHNFIQILDTQIVPTPSDVYNTHGGSKWTMDFTRVAEATHSYPVTRLLWEPPSSTKQSTDLLATSGDHLRLWSLPSDTPSNPGNSVTGRGRDVAATKLTPLALLSNSKTPDHTAPLTSLDWNTVSPSLIITSSIDTTCTIWDIPSLTAKTQLIAHDKEVYDVRFCANSVDVFVSCGQDGSVRMFDLRSLEHSTIIYEPTGKEDRVDANGGKMSPTLAQQTMSNPPPLLRIATSPHDTQLLATFAQDSNVIRILDTRQPGQALLELRGHGGAVNCIDWSPTRRGQLASGGDDCQVLLWDLMSQQQTNGAPQTDSIRSPAASWQCDYEVGNLGWVPRVPSDEAGEWLGVSAGRGIWGVRM
ncbi:hypothetical protein INS49_002845 [Diaporthe citri]|uniref:uncharacterized protein n=1 Tax=Diaporthe citri TaxID=83186 RepID=UPI001C7FCD4A|nr:uncharacterized protein INS49_002845 [Diaporthe citri]KAG6368632.1 hypothetical protein INS49_002845 [Diaporthe citri]